MDEAKIKESKVAYKKDVPGLDERLDGATATFVTGVEAPGV